MLRLRHGRALVSTALVLIGLMASPAVVGATAPVPAPCALRPSASSPLRAPMTRYPSTSGYVPSACMPALVPVDLYDGALLSGGAYEPSAILPDGDAVVLEHPGATTPAESGYTLSLIDPGGHTVWETSAPGYRLESASRVAIGAGEVVNGPNVAIIDLETRKTTTVLAPAHEGTYIGLAGNVAIVATSREPYRPSFPQVLTLYRPDGGRIAQLHLAGRDRPITGVLSGATQAFIVADTAGKDALLYRVLPNGKVLGGTLLKGARGAVPLADISGRLILTGPGTPGRTQILLAYRLAPSGARLVWRQVVPVGTGPLLSTTEIAIGGNPIRLFNLATGQLLRTIATPSGTQGVPIALGPFGIVALEWAPADYNSHAHCLPCVEPVPQQLAAFAPSGAKVWDRTLSTYTPFGTASVYHLGSDDMLVDPAFPGMAVAWGPTWSDNVGASPLSGFGAPNAPPSLPTSRATGYELFANGQPVSASSPLTVGTSQAGVPQTLTLSAVNAQGQPVASAGAAPVELSDGGAGGAFSPGTDGTVTLPRGSVGVTVTYTNAHAGRYVLSAQPAFGQPPAPSVVLPAAGWAGGTMWAAIEFLDTNGVPIPVPANESIVVHGKAGADLAPGSGSAIATGTAPGLFVAQLRLGNATGEVRVYATVDGVNVGSAGPVQVATAVAPTASVVGSPGAEFLVIHRPVTGASPVGYIIYSPADATRPARAVALLTAGGRTMSVPLVTLPSAAGSQVVVAAAYSDNVLGPFSAPVSLGRGTGSG